MCQIISIITSIIISILTSILICARNRKSARNSNPLPKETFFPNLSNPLFQRSIPFSFPLFYLLKMKFRPKENLKRKTFKFFGAGKPTSVPRSCRCFHLALEPIRMRALQLTKAFVLSGLRALISRSIGISTHTTVYVKTYATVPKICFLPKIAL